VLTSALVQWRAAYLPGKIFLFAGNNPLLMLWRRVSNLPWPRRPTRLSDCVKPSKASRAAITMHPGRNPWR